MMRLLPITLALWLAGCAAPPAPPAVGDVGTVVGHVNGPGMLARNGRIIAADAMVAAGGGNLTGPGTSDYVGHNGAALTTRTLLAMADGFAPVVGARVTLTALDGRILGQTTSGPRGDYVFTGVPRNVPLALRTRFRTDDGRSYYLSALMALERPVDGMPLDPINTLVEAKFAALLAGRPAVARTVTMAQLKALWSEANALQASISAREIEASRSIAEMAAVYVELARRHPSLQASISKLLETLGEPAPF